MPKINITLTDPPWERRLPRKDKKRFKLHLVHEATRRAIETLAIGRLFDEVRRIIDSTPRYTWRLAAPGAERYITQDFRPFRANLTVENDIVTKLTWG